MAAHPRPTHPFPVSPSQRLRLRIGLAALWLTAAMGTSAGGAVPSCVWKVYDAARGDPQTIFTDPDATPPFAMRLDSGFRTGGGTLSENGGIDFDGDGRTDPFRLTNRSGGGLQWQYVSGGFPAGWQDLTYAFDDFSTLRFGDFDADGKSDVFAAHYGSNLQQWVFSSAGTGGYQNLAFASANVQIGLGRFDGDLKTDVFGAVPTAMSMSYDFDYSSAGRPTLSICPRTTSSTSDRGSRTRGARARWRPRVARRSPRGSPRPGPCAGSSGRRGTSGAAPGRTPCRRPA